MGQKPHRVDKAWGTRHRLKVPKDAGVVQSCLGNGTNLLCFKEELSYA